MFYKLSVVKLKFIESLLENKKGNLMIALTVFCARDWNMTKPRYQLFIDYVCQNCVVKSERA